MATKKTTTKSTKSKRTKAAASTAGNKPNTVDAAPTTSLTIYQPLNATLDREAADKAYEAARKQGERIAKSEHAYKEGMRGLSIDVFNFLTTLVPIAEWRNLRRDYAAMVAADPSMTVSLPAEMMDYLAEKQLPTPRGQAKNFVSGIFQGFLQSERKKLNLIDGKEADRIAKSVEHGDKDWQEDGPDGRPVTVSPSSNAGYVTASRYAGLTLAMIDMDGEEIDGKVVHAKEIAKWGIKDVGTKYLAFRRNNPALMPAQKTRSKGDEEGTRENPPASPQVTEDTSGAADDQTREHIETENVLDGISGNLTAPPADPAFTESNDEADAAASAMFQQSDFQHSDDADEREVTLRFSDQYATGGRQFLAENSEALITQEEVARVTDKGESFLYSSWSDDDTLNLHAVFTGEEMLVAANAIRLYRLMKARTTRTIEHEPAAEPQG